jgi:hypothetical protein
VGGSDRSLSLLPSEAYLVAEEPEFTATGGRGVANSFATYLIGRFGRDAFQALKVRTPYGTPIEAFEDAVREIYGMSLTELEQAWAQHAPLESCGDGLPWGWDESAPHAYMFAPLTLSADLDCDDLGTKGPIDPRVVLGHATPQPVLPGMYADFDVIVPFASRVRVSLEGPPDATAYLRSGRCWDDFRDGASGTREPDALAGGEAMTLLLGGCLWHVALAASDDEPTAVSLRIEPVADG